MEIPLAVVHQRPRGAPALAARHGPPLPTHAVDLRIRPAAAKSVPPRGSEAGARRRWDEEEQGGEVSRADHNARERAPLWRRPRAGEGRARGGERERRGPEWVVEGHGRKEDSIGLHKKLGSGLYLKETRVGAASSMTDELIGDAVYRRRGLFIKIFSKLIRDAS